MLLVKDQSHLIILIFLVFLYNVFQISLTFEECFLYIVYGLSIDLEEKLPHHQWIMWDTVQMDFGEVMEASYVVPELRRQ